MHLPITGNKNPLPLIFFVLQTVPIVWLRFLPALCGSLLSPCVYKLLLQVRLNRWTATLGGVLIILGKPRYYTI